MAMIRATHLRLSRPDEGLSLNLSENELMAVMHALLEEQDRIKNSGGDQYGPLSPEEMSGLIKRVSQLLSPFLTVHS